MNFDDFLNRLTGEAQSMQESKQDELDKFLIYSKSQKEFEERMKRLLTLQAGDIVLVPKEDKSGRRRAVVTCLSGVRLRVVTTVLGETGLPEMQETSMALIELPEEEGEEKE